MEIRTLALRAMGVTIALILGLGWGSPQTLSAQSADDSPAVNDIRTAEYLVKSLRKKLQKERSEWHGDRFVISDLTKLKDKIAIIQKKDPEWDTSALTEASDSFDKIYNGEETAAATPAESSKPTPKSNGESPAINDIRTAEHLIKSLTKKLQQDSSEWYEDRFVVKDLKKLKEKLELIQTKDPEYDVTNLTTSCDSLHDKYNAVADAANAEKQFTDYFHLKAYESKCLPYRQISDFNSALDQVQKYRDAIVAFNCAEIRAKLVEAKIAVPEIDTDSDVQKIQQAFSEFASFVKDDLAGEVQRILGESRRWMENQPVKAVDIAHSAVVLCDAASLVEAESTVIANAWQEADALYQEFNQSVYGKIFTSDFHRDHANQIVFSSQPLKVGSESDSDISDSFTAGDTIYGTIYFNDEARNVIGSGTQFEILIDGEVAKYNDIEFTTDELGQTWIGIEIVPDPATSDARESVDTVWALSVAAPKVHKVTIRIGRLQGTFSLDLTEGTDGYETRLAALQERRIDLRRMPYPRHTDEALERDFLRICKDKGWKPLRVVLREEWQVHRNGLNQVTHRTVTADVAFEHEPNKAVYQAVILRQEFLGTQFGESTLANVSPTQWAIRPENVNK